MNEEKEQVHTIIVMPAYEAEKTLEDTISNLPTVYDEIILCDDKSKDKTVEVAKKTDVLVLKHQKNLGYGANQKTLYENSLQKNPEVIVMVHPDNQYDTACLPEMIEMIKSRQFDMIMGSRMKFALKNGMPFWKFMGNKLLTFFENAVFGTKLSEFHSGLRVYNAALLKAMPYQSFSNDFVFDSEVIAWTIANDYKIGEVPTNCYYHKASSSINFKRSVEYGLSTLATLVRFLRGYYKKQGKRET